MQKFYLPMFLLQSEGIHCSSEKIFLSYQWYDFHDDIETLSIDGVSNKEHFYRIIMQKIC